MAAKHGKLLISGGDRHGIEPTPTSILKCVTFTEFIHEVRYPGISNVLFMPQYAEPWKHRILQSTLDAIQDYPKFPEGSRHGMNGSITPTRTARFARSANSGKEAKRHPTSRS